MTSTAGAVFLAHEQQHREAEAYAVSVPPATVPLYEAAAAHDGQPPADWLRLFKRLWQWQ